MKSSSQAASILGITRQAVHDAITRGILHARCLQVGGYRLWQISDSEIECYRLNHLGKVGRKPKRNALNAT